MLELQIKNMVCQRCVDAVQTIFKDGKIDIDGVELGKVILKTPLKDEEQQDVSIKLLEQGFELLSSVELKTVNEIKSFLLETLDNTDRILEKNMSYNLSQHLAKDYSYLSKLFSKYEGRTIENYLISLRIERAKELLSYNEKTISEIAIELGFSSIAHLSNQFKKYVGKTPSKFRKITDGERIGLDKI